MSRAGAHSPFRDGFSALWHEPALLPAELVWRWCFGFSALMLGLIAIALFLNSLKLSAADELLLRSQQPHLLTNALQHIFRGSLSRFVLEQSVLLLGTLLLWALATTAGRAATLCRLVAMFSAEDETSSMRWDFAPIFVLQLLRATWSLIAYVVAVGFLVWGMIMAQDEHPLRAAMALSFGVGLSALTGILLNWYFGLAPLFCVRNNAGAAEALDQTVGFSSRHSGRLLLLGAGFLLLRLVWAASMSFVFLSPLSLLAQIDGRLVALLMGAAALVYFAGVDLLYLARWGSYVSLAEEDANPAPAADISLPNTTPPPSIEPPDVVPLVGLA
jgi:hypothetical protein